VEIRIGILHAPREIVIESSETAEAIQTAVEAAIAAQATLQLNDEKGRVVLVPIANLGYIDIAAVESRRVGFGKA
jgi:predicted alternative tryptophan synthase beta-subunit